MKTVVREILFNIFAPFLVRNFLKDFDNSFQKPKKYYGYCLIFFKSFLSKEIVAQRKYFNVDQRSFGEDAFTVMWYFLYKKYKFESFLEIGVYRGQVLHLISLFAKLENNEIAVAGISPLTDANDSVSTYPKIDYVRDIRQHFEQFQLSQPKLIKHYSTDVEATDEISSRIWDCVYIDGSHDEEIVRQDFLNTITHLKLGGIMVFDDASQNLGSTFYGEFSGHPGPSAIVDQIVSKRMKEILRVGHNRCFLKTHHEV